MLAGSSRRICKCAEGGPLLYTIHYLLLQARKKDSQLVVDGEKIDQTEHFIKAFDNFYIIQSINNRSMPQM